MLKPVSGKPIYWNGVKRLYQAKQKNSDRRSFYLSDLTVGSMPDKAFNLMKYSSSENR
jgi:hypothetical protein